MSENVSIVLISLNDSKCIEKMLVSISKSKYDELIVVDGGSIDNTIEIASRYTNLVYTAEKGMLNQTLYGLSVASCDYIFLAESDHVYPDGFLQSLKSELLNSNYDAIQGTMAYINKSNFWERGHSEFYKIHGLKKGERSIIACPQIWKKKSLVNLLASINVASQGFSFDTQRAELAQRMGICVGLGNTIAYEDQDINWKKFLNRHTNYGRGDYEFYKNNSPNWSYLRKMKSLFHIFLRYGVDYPIKSIFNGNPLIGVPYFYVVLFIRYYAWIRCVLNGGDYK